ncbi:MAG: ABC transporter ATP-binding protein [Bryobacteraceae bacterium]
MTAAAAPLRGEGLSKAFAAPAGRLVVFSGVDIEVRRGERVALTGESGAGKTTLLYLLGLLERPTEGRVWIDGADVSAMNETQLAEVRNRRIGYVWQRNTLLGEFTALENVMMPLLIRGVSRPEARDAAAALLEEAGLAHRARHLAGELSGGEQQRVALARALAGKPSILLADEPTGSLDERTAAQVMDLIEAVHERHGLATLYVTHNPAFARRAHRVLRLEGGVLRPA